MDRTHESFSSHCGLFDALVLLQFNKGVVVFEELLAIHCVCRTFHVEQYSSVDVSVAFSRIYLTVILSENLNLLSTIYLKKGTN